MTVRGVMGINVTPASRHTTLGMEAQAVQYWLVESLKQNFGGKVQLCVKAGDGLSAQRSVTPHPTGLHPPFPVVHKPSFKITVPRNMSGLPAAVRDNRMLCTGPKES